MRKTQRQHIGKIWAQQWSEKYGTDFFKLVLEFKNILFFKSLDQIRISQLFEVKEALLL